VSYQSHRQQSPLSTSVRSASQPFEPSPVIRPARHRAQLSAVATRTAKPREGAISAGGRRAARTDRVPLSPSLRDAGHLRRWRAGPSACLFLRSPNPSSHHAITEATGLFPNRGGIQKRWCAHLQNLRLRCIPILVFCQSSGLVTRSPPRPDHKRLKSLKLSLGGIHRNEGARLSIYFWTLITAKANPSFRM
jgi:hypothetical protein